MFSSHWCTNYPVGTPYCDHLEEQLSSAEVWGNVFALASVVDRGDPPPSTEVIYWKILATASSPSMVMGIISGQESAGVETPYGTHAGDPAAFLAPVRVGTGSGVRVGTGSGVRVGTGSGSARRRYRMWTPRANSAGGMQIAMPIAATRP